MQALIDAVQRATSCRSAGTGSRRELLGLDRLADYDRMAAVTADEAIVRWSDGKALVLDAYQAFSPELGIVAAPLLRRALDRRAAAAGQARAARSAPTRCRRVHPYVLLNYTHRRRDVLMLAHELGHGVHAALAAQQGIFHQSTPLTLAETASVFGEAMTFGRCSSRPPTPRRGSRCWPSRSRARSRPCSARRP